MGLILPQTVKVRIWHKNAKYYENLGYNVRKEPYGTTRISRKNELVYNVGLILDIPVTDLYPNSVTKIKCNCDGCGTTLNIRMCAYTEHNIEGKIYCFKCTMAQHSRENHHAWNPNLTEEERIKKRTGMDYHIFVKNVLERDNYTCQVCGEKSGTLEVHHLDGYNWCIDKRLDVTNGITLCNKCHNQFHTIYGKIDNTKEQFYKWFGKRIELKDYKNSNIIFNRIICLETGEIYNTISDAAKIMGTSITNVSANVQGKSLTCLGKHLIYYEKFLNMSKEEIEKTINTVGMNKRCDHRVICLTDGLLYKTVKDACKLRGNIKEHNIRASCKGRIKKTGRLSLDKEEWTKWIWFEDFIKKPYEKIIEILNEYERSFNQGSFLYTVNTQRELITQKFISKVAEERMVK